eukprot:s1309_g6.t1
MSVTVEVRLLSGRTATIEADLDEELEALILEAQTALDVTKGRLVDSSGSVLDAGALIRDTPVQNGDSLMLQISPVQTCRNERAFAAILGDASVVTSGVSQLGGDSSAVQSQLKNVQQIQATHAAFAAILGDGSDQLKNVQHVQANQRAFAAILGDGSVVTWGYADHGGDISAVRAQLTNVQQIQATGYAFAAILGDGSAQLTNVQQIQASRSAFAAILGDGSVVTWGSTDNGGDSSDVQEQLKNVHQIQATDYAFAAILGDGSVVTWGDPRCGGGSSAAQDQLKNVQQIQAGSLAFAAILGDGSEVTWGSARHGGDCSALCSAVQEQLKNLQQVQAADSAFAAILGDGSVVTWGDANSGGDSNAVQDQLTNVQQIQANRSAFAAVLGDGSVVTWGTAQRGGCSSALQDQLKDVQHIQATGRSFAAILVNGTVVSNLHKNTSDSFAETCRALHEYRDKQGRQASLISEEVAKFVREKAGELDEAIVYKRDYDYDYFGFKTLEKSYLLRVHGRIVERPQHLLMRVACGIHCGASPLI